MMPLVGLVQTKPTKANQGFTLLEVMVALVLIGIGFGVALSGMSGSLRLTQRAKEHENAVLLAKARLAEAAAYPDYEIEDDTESENYGGIEYSYRIEFTPIILVDKKFQPKVKMPVRLEEIRVTVYWGDNASQSYSLSTFKTIQDEELAAAAQAEQEQQSSQARQNTNPFQPGRR